MKETNRRDFMKAGVAGLAGILTGAVAGSSVFADAEHAKNGKMRLLESVLTTAKKREKEKVKIATPVGEEIYGGQAGEERKETELVFPETDILANEFEGIVSSLDQDSAKAVNKLKSSIFSGNNDVESVATILQDKWQEVYEHEFAHQKSIKNMAVHVGNIFLKKETIVPLATRASEEYGVPLWVIMGVIGVESGGDQYAYNSDSGAAGIMQITEGTAKSLGLKMDWETGADERFDMEKNVMAAAKYLNKLYERFGQWSLALTAYSGGPTNLQQRITRCFAKNNVRSGDFGASKTELDIPPASELKEKGVNIVTLYSKQFCGQGGDHSIQYPFWVEAMARLMGEKFSSSK